MEFIKCNTLFVEVLAMEVVVFWWYYQPIYIYIFILKITEMRIPVIRYFHLWYIQWKIRNICDFELHCISSLVFESNSEWKTMENKQVSNSGYLDVINLYSNTQKITKILLSIHYTHYKYLYHTDTINFNRLHVS